MNRVLVSESMLESAVRYALGRATYIVRLTCGEVKSAWDGLTPRAQQVIERDVREALERVDFSGSTLGFDIDDREWRGLLYWIEERPAYVR